MDDSLYCLFFLTVYAATSNRGCLPGKANSGEEAVLTEATHFACGGAVMSDAFSRTGRKQRVPPPWKATLGEETVFAEVVRVESGQAAMPATFRGQDEKATVN